YRQKWVESLVERYALVLSLAPILFFLSCLSFSFSFSLSFSHFLSFFLSLPLSLSSLFLIPPFHAQKYVRSGIIFKFALDQPMSGSGKWMYGGGERHDAAAIKAAKNELLGLSTYFSCGVPRLHYPLM